MGDILLGISGTRGWEEKTLYATESLNIILDQLYPYMTSIFPTGSGMFLQDNASCHKARIVLEWFQENDAEFQLMFRVQILPRRNILDLRDRCLNIRYNLSPATYQGLMVSIPRRVAIMLTGDHNVLAHECCSFNFPQRRWLLLFLNLRDAVALLAEQSAPDRRSQVRDWSVETTSCTLMAPGAFKIRRACNVLQVPTQIISLGVPKRGEPSPLGGSKLRWHVSRPSLGI